MAYDDRDDELDIRKPGAGGGDVPNYMTQAILVTLCCCLPFGIAAIVQAANVNTALAKGDYAAAVKASDDAKKYCWIGFIGGLIALPIWFALQVMNSGGFK